MSLNDLEWPFCVKICFGLGIYIGLATGVLAFGQNCSEICRPKHTASGKSVSEGLYSVSKNPSPEDLSQIFPKWLGIFQPNFTCLLPFLSTLEYEFLFNYLQLWRSYAILNVTTQFPIMCAKCPPSAEKLPTLAFSDISPKQLGIFSPNFAHLLKVHTYARMPIVVQLSPTMTTLCHIKCDHPACVLVDGGHFEHIMVVALNVA